jgi:WD40 repeat protein
VISPDGTHLATAGADGLLEVFRLPDLTSTQQIPASEKPLSMAAFSNDGKFGEFKSEVQRGCLGFIG